MSLSLAQSHAWNLAQTLMVSITLFRSEMDGFGIVETSEFDGDPESVVYEYDPWEIRGR